MDTPTLTDRDVERVGLSDGIEEWLDERNQAACRQALASSLTGRASSLFPGATRWVRGLFARVAVGARQIIIRQRVRQTAGQPNPASRAAFKPTGL
jgi:hypothetical protein